MSREIYSNNIDNLVSAEQEAKDLKKLNKFTKELSTISSVEELMKKFRKQLKVFDRVKDPTLILTSSKEACDVFYFQGSAVKKTTKSIVWRGGGRIRLNDYEDRVDLAKVLERPVAKVIFFPIPDIACEAAIVLEHDLEENRQNLFISFLGSRLQALALTLDTILIEQELKTSTLLWERTFSGISEPVAIINPQFNLIRANQSFGKDVEGEKCFSVFAGRDQPCDFCPMQNRKQENDETSAKVSRSSSEYLVKSFPIAFEGGNPVVGYINHYINVDRVKHLKSELIQNEKMAALGQLAGNLAHELNNPLTGIRALSQLLVVQDNVAPEIRNDLLEVEKASQRCQAIIGNLLDFTKTTSGDLGPIEPDLIVSKTIPLVKAALYRVNLNIELDAKSVRIIGEAQLLQQVIFNLIINACQALAEGGHINVSSFCRDNDYYLEISDDGCGIPEDQREQIFEPFFTTKPAGEGTGLGLSMVKSIVEKFDGRIEVDSKEQQGTKITLIFSSVDK